MKKNLTSLFLIGAAILSLTVTSCNRWLNPGPETYATWATLAISDPFGDISSSPYYFITDDTLLLYPMNHSSVDTEFKAVHGQRLILYYTDYESPEGAKSYTLVDNSHIRYINIVQMQLMTTRKIVKTSQPDTLGTDAIDPQYIWFGGGVFGTSRYLNMQLFLHAMDPEAHTFNLAHDLNRESPLEDGYYFLELRHNAHHDPEFVDYTAMLSFLLEGDCIEEGVKGLKIKVRTNNQGTKVYTFDYPKN